MSKPSMELALCFVFKAVGYTQDTFCNITKARSQREVVCFLEAEYVSTIANNVVVLVFWLYNFQWGWLLAGRFSHLITAKILHRCSVFLHQFGIFYTYAKYVNYRRVGWNTKLSSFFLQIIRILKKNLNCL